MRNKTIEINDSHFNKPLQIYNILLNKTKTQFVIFSLCLKRLVKYICTVYKQNKVNISYKNEILCLEWSFSFG